MKVFRFAVITICIFCMFSLSLAADKTAKKQKSSYATAPFDISITKIPMKYLGNDLVSMYGAISRWKWNTEKPVKDKFETAENFAKRLDMYENSFPKGYGRDDLFATQVSATLNYDADTHKTSADFEFDDFENYPHLFKEQQYCRTAKRQTKEKTTHRYGSNAFGVTVKIDEQFTDYINLAITNPDFFGLTLSSCRSKFLFDLPNMPANSASKLDGNLSVLIIFKLAKPFVENNTGSSHIPTIDAPFGYYYNFDYIVGNIVDAWLYNKKTGEILIKKSKINRANEK